MSTTSHSTVSAAQGLRLIGPDDLTVPLTARLDYKSQDPYAIKMSLDAGRAEPVEWTFSRDLLTAALHAPEGHGDVRAWPSMSGPGEPQEKVLNIELGSPDGHALFEASAAGIGAFLARTYEVVPAGQEPAFLDFDDELTELLSQA
jgi:Streptomyces sporulation and cell division protein, SsgA